MSQIRCLINLALPFLVQLLVKPLVKHMLIFSDFLWPIIAIIAICFWKNEYFVTNYILNFSLYF